MKILRKLFEGCSITLATGMAVEASDEEETVSDSGISSSSRFTGVCWG